MNELLEAQELARPIVMKILGEFRADTNDVLQEATISALTSKATFSGRSKFSTWYTRIAINAAKMRLRKADIRILRASVAVEDLNLSSLKESPEQFAIRRERESWLYEVLDTMSPKRRAAIYRWLLGETAATSRDKGRRHQAKKEIKAYFENRQGGVE